MFLLPAPALLLLLLPRPAPASFTMKQGRDGAVRVKLSEPELEPATQAPPAMAMRCSPVIGCPTLGESPFPSDIAQLAAGLVAGEEGLGALQQAAVSPGGKPNLLQAMLSKFLLCYDCYQLTRSRSARSGSGLPQSRADGSGAAGGVRRGGAVRGTDEGGRAAGRGGRQGGGRGSGPLAHPGDDSITRAQ